MPLKQYSIHISILFLMVLNINLNGQILQWEWAAGINSDDRERVHDIVVDQSDNSVYVAGQFNGDLSAVFPSGTGPATDMSSTSGDIDGFVAKYNAEGTFLWAFKLGGPMQDVARAIDIDENGNIYVCGYAEAGDCYALGTSSFTLEGTWTNLNKTDFFIAKFNPDGVLLWLKHSSSDLGDFSGEDLSVSSDAVYAIGNYDNEGNFGSLDNLDRPIRTDIFIIKYDHDGNELWLTNAGSNEDDLGRAIFAEEDSIYILADFSGPNLLLNHANGGDVLSIVNSINKVFSIAIATYDSSGQVLWAKKIASDNEDISKDLTVSADSIFITGAIQNNALFPSYSANPVLSSGDQDIFLSAHSKTDGSTGWVKTIPCSNTGAQWGKAITSDANGNIYFCGDFKDNIDFPGPTQLSSIGAEDCFIASYTMDGTFRWAQRMGSSSYDDINAVAIGSQHSIYAAGRYTKDFDAGTLTLPESPSNNGFLLKIKEYSPPGNDNPCSAILIDVNDSCVPKVFTNEDASNSGIPDPGCGGYVNNDVWFKTIVPPSGNVFLSANTGDKELAPPENGNMWSAAMAIYSGSCNSLMNEACFAANAAQNFRGTNAYMQNMIPGDTLWIRIWEMDGDQNGYFTICAFDPGSFPGWTLEDLPCDNRDSINLDTTLTKTKIGWGNEISDFNGTVLANESLGAADGIGAELFNDGDWLILKFEDAIPKGEVYHLIMKTKDDIDLLSKLNIYSSVDNSSFIAHSFRPESMQDEYMKLAIIAEENTKYLKIANENTEGGGFLVDAVEYAFRATKGGSWSGPGVNGSFFNPVGLSDSVSIMYSAGTDTNISDSMIMVLLRTTPVAHPGADSEICGLSFDLQATLSDRSFGLWELIDGPGTPLFAPSLTDPQAKLTVDEYSTYELRWTETRDGCSDDSTINITFWEAPIQSVASEIKVCGSLTQLDAGTPIGTGFWKQSAGPGTSSFSPSNTVAKPSVEVSKYGSYLFVWEEINGPCIQESSRDVKFLEALSAYAGEDIFLTNEYETYLDAKEPKRGNGMWKLLSGNGLIEWPDQAYTLVSELGIGNNEFTWTVSEKDAICPESSDTILILLEVDIEEEATPTLITPNGDGKNDRLLIPAINENTKATIRIFNRWGEEVFFSESYTNDWDGKDKKGRDLLPDTYFYILIIEGDEAKKKFIEIRR